MIISVKSQQGFSAMIVVVLIVLFALLGTFMATMSTISSLNTTQSASAMQAWFAARAGVEWAVQRSLATSGPGCTCAVNGQTLTFAEGGSDGYVATVSCMGHEVVEASTAYCVYDLDVNATNNSATQMTKVARTISFSLSDRNAP